VANITPTELRFCFRCEHYGKYGTCRRKQRPSLNIVTGTWESEGDLLYADRERRAPTFTEHLFRVDKCGPRGTYFVERPTPAPAGEDE
jgi:hypothetical protein